MSLEADELLESIAVTAAELYSLLVLADEMQIATPYHRFVQVFEEADDAAIEAIDAEDS